MLGFGFMVRVLGLGFLFRVLGWVLDWVLD